MSHVEVDEVFGLVGDIGAEVAADNGVPGGVVLLVELFFDVGRNILLDIELLECHIRAVNGILLHLFVHVSVFDHCLPLSCRHYQLNKIKSNSSPAFPRFKFKLL